MNALEDSDPDENYQPVKNMQVDEKEQHQANDENRLTCEIRMMTLFKTCLESVKFPTSSKSKYNVSAQFLI